MRGIWTCLAAALVLVACGDDTETTDDDGGSSTTSSSTGGATSSSGGGATTGTGGMNVGGGGGGPSGTVPDPGMGTGFNWDDVEPNDMPSQAVPVGPLQGAFWMGFGQIPSRMESATDVDYYVFRTANPVDVFQPLAVCYTFAGDLLDVALYNVVNSQVGSLVKEVAGADAQGCATLYTVQEANMELMPDTVYLLEIKAAPGLMLGGDMGFYTA